MTQDQAMAVERYIKTERSDCVVVAHRMVDWNGTEWWYVQVENPKAHTIVAVTNLDAWISVLSPLI